MPRGAPSRAIPSGGRDIPPGTEYGYYIQAKFEGKSGAGNRVEGRACAIKFEKR